MERKEELIVSMTSWKPRFCNLPLVLDSVFAQTIKPDRVVLNIADDEILPDCLLSYLDGHSVEIYRMPNTKVFKKLIPTLRRYPDACVISIDDDYIYPRTMIADFVGIHEKYPEFPISGNNVMKYGMQCHCGDASLTKASYFGEYLKFIDDDLIRHCDSDDMVYTFLCTKNGNPYIRSQEKYFLNMVAIESQAPYSVSQKSADKDIERTFRYLRERFGNLDCGGVNYIRDGYIRDIAGDVERSNVISVKKMILKRLFRIDW